MSHLAYNKPSSSVARDPMLCSLHLSLAGGLLWALLLGPHSVELLPGGLATTL